MINLFNALKTSNLMIGLMIVVLSSSSFITPSLAQITQTVDMYSIENPFQNGGDGPAVGEGATATLTRTDSGLGLSISTNNLPMGTYTMWLIIYNDPALCNNGDGVTNGQCDVAGDMINDTIATLLRGGGDVVGEDGTLDISSWTPKDGGNELPGSLYGTLMEPFLAEVRLLLLWHGDPLMLGSGTSPDTLEAQLHDIQGGCGYYRMNGGMEPSPIEVTLFGGPFEFCPMMQGAVFPSPEGNVITGPPGFMQSNSLYTIADPYQGGGWADIATGGTVQLWRMPVGIGMFLEATDLPRGTYTVWFIIYNDPSQCSNMGMNPLGECDAGADMLNQDIASLLRGGGDVVDDTGRLTISTWFPTGGDATMQLPGSLYGTLKAPFQAEIQLLLLWHGEPLPLISNSSSPLDTLGAQIHDIQGGCGYYRINGGMDPAPIQIDLFGGPFDFCPMIQGAVLPSQDYVGSPSSSPAPSVVTTMSMAPSGGASMSMAPSGGGSMSMAPSEQTMSMAPSEQTMSMAPSSDGSESMAPSSDGSESMEPSGGESMSMSPSGQTPQDDVPSASPSSSPTITTFEPTADESSAPVRDLQMTATLLVSSSILLPFLTTMILAVFT